MNSPRVFYKVNATFFAVIMIMIMIMVMIMTIVDVTLDLFFYHSKRKFTMVNEFFNVTHFSHFTMVNTSLVCCVSNGGRMKAKLTIVKPSQKAWFIARLSKLCLFRLHLVMNFEKHFVTLLNLLAPTICMYTCFRSPSRTIF